MYRLSAEVNREIVGGSCESVGILGWMIGGGRGLTSPFYGLGVDQLISAELVDGNGKLVTASATQNPDIFFAIKGGGFGFGVIYSIRIKLHKPRRRTTNWCRSMANILWKIVTFSTMFNGRDLMIRT